MFDDTSVRERQPFHPCYAGSAVFIPAEARLATGLGHAQARASGLSTIPTEAFGGKRRCVGHVH